MQYRKIKKNNDTVSLLGYGCMRLPEKFGKVDVAGTRAQVEYAIAGGINYFDTGFLYHGGQSETVLGQILAENGNRSRVKVTTKLPHWMCDKSGDFDSFLSTQLRRLKTSQLDYYLIHALNGKAWERLKQLEIEKFLDAVKKDGRASAVGFSFHDHIESFKKIVDEYDWDVCQIQYNLLDEANQAGREGLDYAAERELGVFIMEPLRGGLLANTVPGEVKRLYQQFPVKRSPAGWAMRWVMNHPGITCVLSGMNSLEQIKENMTVAESTAPESMAEAELVIIEDVKKLYKSLLKVGCTGCGYCLPCPAGVNIPVCFELYNTKYLKDRGEKSNAAQHAYTFRCGGTSGAPGLASQCVACGKCEERCPQGINIPTQLEMVKKEFEGAFFRQRIEMHKMFVNRLKKDVSAKEAGRL